MSESVVYPSQRDEMLDWPRRNANQELMKSRVRSTPFPSTQPRAHGKKWTKYGFEIKCAAHPIGIG